MPKPLTEIAPYPSMDEVTAESLLRYETVAAYAQEVGTYALSKAAHSTPPGSPEWRRYYDSAAALSARFAVVFLLRQIRELAPGRADDIAQQLHGLWMDGGVIPELLYDWLGGYGIDPDEVEQVVLSEKREAA